MLGFANALAFMGFDEAIRNEAFGLFCALLAIIVFDQF